ncbi:MAG: Rpn family recombination-promoting nuclease/putative transposase [Deltaproteobacteria bacterium]|jgi:hypothetical protein|nr:Rpn family recombination-promoting nuclease/putative transposase [Deltaproteobacteria bacterium]
MELVPALPEAAVSLKISGSGSQWRLNASEKKIFFSPAKPGRGLGAPSMADSENNTDSRLNLPMPRKAPSPLADPIFCKMFQNETVSGKAMKFLVNAVIKNSKFRTFEEVKEIIKITPQYYLYNLGLDRRSYCIDVEAETSDNDIILVEVQLNKFMSMTDRILLYSSSHSGSQARCGEELKDVTKKMNRVLPINILNYTIRPSSPQVPSGFSFILCGETA